MENEKLVTLNEANRPFWKKLISFLGWQGMLFAFLFFCFAIFLLQNSEPMRMNFLWWRFVEHPKLYFILLFYGTGFLSGLLFALRLKRSKAPHDKVEKSG